jgi:outer membrane lipoprotein SlyB
VFGCIYILPPATKGSDATIGALAGGIVGALAGTFIGMRATDTWVPGTLAAR